MPDRPPFNLGEAFRTTTSKMLASFSGARQLTHHASTLGSDLERQWKETLEDFLPRRFAVNPAFVVDCRGQESEQMDLVVHDRHFSPMFWTMGGTLFLPAECVYAVIEVKPALTREYVTYAGAKAASVRRLHRTSAPIRQLAQSARPAELPRILAAIVAARSGWNPPLGEPLADVLRVLADDHRLDLGCALDSGMFEVPNDGDIDSMVRSTGDVGLAMFAMRLVARLNAMGTVPALDYDAYTSGITELAVEGPARESL